MPEQQDHNKLLRLRSGEVNIHSRLVSFLYDLMRDHLPVGTVEELVRNADIPDVQYTNGWLARYAEDLALRLEDKLDDDAQDMTAFEEQYEKKEEERRRRIRERDDRMMMHEPIVPIIVRLTD